MNSNTDIYASIFDRAVQAIILIDHQGTIKDVNPAVEKILGHQKNELIGQNVSVLMPSPYREEHDDYLATHLQTGVTNIIGVGREIEALHKNGNLIPVELSVSKVVDNDDVFFVGMLNDISERRESEYLLDLNNRVMRAINSALGSFINASVAKKEVFDGLLEKLLDITNSGYGFIGDILHKEDHTPYLKTYAITNIAWNYETRKFYRENIRKGMEFHNLDTLFGITIRTGEVVISNDPANDPRSGGLPSGHPDLNAYLGLPIFSGNKLLGMAGIANRPGGYDEELADLLKPLLGTIGSLIAGYQNLHSRRKAEQALYRAQAKLRQLATQDSLTNIANRNSLLEQLQDAFDRSRQIQDQFSLLFIDIDHFKQINDSLGHKAGDDVLKRAVEIIRESMRPSDIFGRYGGEEFLLGLLDCDEENALQCAERLRGAVEQASVELGEGREPLKLTVSIGVATVDTETLDIDSLIHRADLAMYEAKNAGRNCSRAYSGEDSKASTA